MKSFGFHNLGIEAIAYDEQDIAERQQTQRVLDLATSRKAIPINPVTVASGKLVAGRDRLAADLLNGARAVWCHVVTECTPADLLRIEVEENVRRRDIDRDVQLARLVAVTEKEIQGKPPGKSGKQGRPVTPKGEARAAVAKVAGTTVEAVRRAETRAAAKTEPPKPSAPAPFPIRDFGVAIEDEAALREQVERVGGILSSAAKALQRAQAAFTEASEQLAQLSADEVKDGKLPAKMLADAARLREQTHKLADQCRANVPAALCAYCKGALLLDGNVCTFCCGVGYATVHAMASMPIPAELLREGAEAMVSNGAGGFVKFTPKQAAPVSSRGPKAGKPPKDVRRENPDPAPSAAAGFGAEMPPAQRIAMAEMLLEEGLVSKEGAGRFIETGSARAPKHRPINVEMPDGRRVDALNPPDDLAYSGDEAPPADLPELVVEPDEALGGDDDSELWT